MISNLEIMPSFLDALGFSQQYRDIICIIENPNIYNIGTSVQLENIQPHLVIPSDSINISYNQEVETENNAGGGAEQNTFMNRQMNINVNINIPLMSHVSGMVDPVFSKLWQLAYYAFWGSPTYIVCHAGGISGDNTLIVDNIADFLPIANAHIVAYISDGVNSENVIIVGANKSSRRINLQGVLSNSYSLQNSILYTRMPHLQFLDDPSKDPVFAISSLFYGYMMPCLVNKVNIKHSAQDVVSVGIDMLVGNIYGDKSKQIADCYNDVVKLRSKLPPYRIVYGNTVDISDIDSTTGMFGLPIFSDLPYTGGFLGLDIYNNTISQSNIYIDNNLQPIYTLWSPNKYEHRHQENMMPFGYYSSGRKIYGEIVFKNPIFPLALTQKYAGPDEKHFGIKFDFKCFSITIPKIVWSPGSVNGRNDDIEKTLQWKMVSNIVDDSLMPELEYSYII